VDLDQDQQLVSMIFGATLTLVDSQGHIAFEGSLEPAPFTDMWRRSETGPGDEAASVAYQSVISVRSWGDLSASAFLQQLRDVAGEDLLSIKFNLDGYRMRRNPPERFARGRVVGTVGAAAPHEPRHFVAGRHFGTEVGPLGNAGTDFRPDSGINYFAGVFDAERGKVRLDLGNAVPVAPPGGPAQDVGDLRLGWHQDDGTIQEIGEIDYRSDGWYEQGAGIVDLPDDRVLSTSERELIQRSALCLVADRQGRRVSVSEEVDAHVRADLFVARLNPGDRFTVRFWALRRGRPAARARIELFRLPVDDKEAERNFPVDGLSFPRSVACDEDGIAEATMVAGDPGDPRFFYSDPPTRRVHIDGQVYRVGYRLDGHTHTNPWDFLSVLVWNNFVADEPPTWHGSMRKVFVQYGNLYPAMARLVCLDLADYEQVAAKREAIAAAIDLDSSHPSYMPVTRDLSRSRHDAMLRWLRNPGPDGKPLLGVPLAPGAIPEPALVEAEPIEDPAVELEVGSKTVAGRRTRIGPL
jgi:hypothetical protein